MKSCSRQTRSSQPTGHSRYISTHLFGHNGPAPSTDSGLVARSLKSRWEAKLAALAEAEAALADLRQAKPPLPDPQALQTLAADLPRLWDASTTTPKDRKRLLRTLIADIIIREVDFDQAHIGIRWHTGAVDEVTADCGYGHSLDLGCDASDPHRVAAFWALALGYSNEPGYDDPDGASTIDPNGKGPLTGHLHRRSTPGSFQDRGSRRVEVDGVCCLLFRAQLYAVERVADMPSCPVNL